jgi:nitrite reductase/ring-hydroxylating ferredoxin subunit/uncharacterized membrane protein
MRSRASIKGHPIHPALIPFPIAFLAGAFAFDLAGRLLERPDFANIAANLEVIGVGMALLAAIPGIIDYFKSVPPKSTGKKRATRHALANLSATVLFAIAWGLRPDLPGPAPSFILALEGLGALLLAVGGWMGGTLAFRNQIGVDHRYAEAGKWSEATITAQPNKPVTVAHTDDLEVDQMKLLRVNGERIVLARSRDGYLAFSDHCTHRGGSLAGGSMICGTVQCPWHGSQFDAKTGQVRAGPAKERIVVYDVETKGEEVRLVIPEDRP